MMTNCYLGTIETKVCVVADSEEEAQERLNNLAASDNSDFGSAEVTAIKKVMNSREIPDRVLESRPLGTEVDTCNDIFES